MYEAKVGENSRAILQTLCPQEGRGEYKEGIENVIQSANESDTAAYASSEDGFWKTGSFAENMIH